MLENPKLQISMTPQMSDACDFLSCDVQMLVEYPDLAKDEEAAAIWKEIAWVPCCEMSEAGLVAEDAAGILPLEKSVEKDPHFGFDKYVWRAGRNTVGNVILCYRIYPRDVSGINRCHPLFDTICEKNGALLCCVTALLMVPWKQYEISFTWNQSEMPADAQIVSSRGENADVSFTGTPQDYLMTLFLLGRVKKASVGNGRQGAYWLDDALPDAQAVKEQLPQVIEAVSRFFGAEDLYYHVFFRKEPFEISNSGTAFPMGFSYGYSDTMPLCMENGLNTLTHETVHNWTNMQNQKGEGAWYNEGAAEYYSLMIPLWSGIADADRVAGWLTTKSVNYYSNPWQNLSLEEANQRTWKDSRNNALQRVPYGRGLFYLADVDLQMKKAGKGDLQTLVLPLSKKKQIRNADWEQALQENLGEKAVEQFHGMLAGAYLPANPEWFDGMFRFRTGSFSDKKEGNFENALIWSRV